MEYRVNGKWKPLPKIFKETIGVAEADIIYLLLYVAFCGTCFHILPFDCTMKQCDHMSLFPCFIRWLVVFLVNRFRFYNANVVLRAFDSIVYAVLALTINTMHYNIHNVSTMFCSRWKCRLLCDTFNILQPFFSDYCFECKLLSWRDYRSKKKNNGCLILFSSYILWGSKLAIMA